MKTTKKLFTVSLLLYILINGLFILKYALRFSSPAMALALFAAYTFFVLVAMVMAARWWNSSSRLIVVKPWLPFATVAAVLAVMALAQWLINPYALQVDRWSAIHNFLYSLLHGVYPYSVQTHLGGYGSPFPVWQIFHLPFYLLGNVGWSFIFGVLLFFDSLRRLSGLRRSMLAFALLAASPAFLYEVLVRSDLMTNFLMVAAMVFYFHHYRVSLQRHWLWVTAMCGLVLSTRLSASIPLCIFLFPQFLKCGFWRQMSTIVFSLTVFALTFLPFILWDGEMLLFFEYNPFVLQTRQGHLSDLAIIIFFGILASLYWRGLIVRYATSTASCLLLLVIVTFVHNMWADSSWLKLFESQYDITYFNMALPFVITVMVMAYLPPVSKVQNKYL